MAASLKRIELSCAVSWRSRRLGEAASRGKRKAQHGFVLDLRVFVSLGSDVDGSVHQRSVYSRSRSSTYLLRSRGLSASSTCGTTLKCVICATFQLWSDFAYDKVGELIGVALQAETRKLWVQVLSIRSGGLACILQRATTWHRHQLKRASAIGASKPTLSEPVTCIHKCLSDVDFALCNYMRLIQFS